MQILTGILFAFLISWGAFHFRALTRSGAAAAFALGSVIYAAGGLIWSIPLLLFFLTSNFWSRFSSKGKSGASSSEPAGRKAVQVLANGGLSMVLGLITFLYPHQNWTWPAYLGSLAAANADTWATELGSRSSAAPRLITTGSRVPPGTSGAVSPAGSLAALSGAALIACLVFVQPPLSGAIAGFFTLTLSGFWGSLVDSLLGAAWQGVYFCHGCQMETEKHPDHHCGTRTRIIRGKKWLTNDLVNFFASTAGAGAAVILQLIILH